MQIRPLKSKLITNYLIASFIIAIIIFACFNKIFLTTWNWEQIVIISCFILADIVLLILTIKTTFYIVKKDHLEFWRWGKALHYYFKDIVYIEETKNDKSATISFYTLKGHWIYLMNDSKSILYDTLISSSTNLLTKEEFIRKYPNAK